MSGLNRNAAIYFSGRGVPPVRWAAAAKPAKQVGGRNTVAETGGTPVPLCATALFMILVVLRCLRWPIC